MDAFFVELCFIPVYAIGFVMRLKKAIKMRDLDDFGTEASRLVGTKTVQIMHV